MRPETGPMKFALSAGDDWPGIFIRGDNAYGYAMVLRAVMDSSNIPPMERLELLSLLQLLESSNIQSPTYDEDTVQLAVLTGNEELRRSRRGE